MTVSAGLAVRDLGVARDGTPVLRNIGLNVPSEQVTVLLGANGAGKTTLLEAISGCVQITSGTVTIDGTDVQRVSREKRARLGLAHIQQGRVVFPDLTVEENLLVAGPRSEFGSTFELFPELKQLRSRRAGLLSGGEQQMVVIARALVSRPKVIMLDELSLGLAPAVVMRMARLVPQLAQSGAAVLLVEQFASVALSVASRAYVLAHGEIAYEGSPEQLDANRLGDLYLGRPHA
jgi:branched-chain amino acid transport system ATP-binding protein